MMRGDFEVYDGWMRGDVMMGLMEVMTGLVHFRKWCYDVLCTELLWYNAIYTFPP